MNILNFENTEPYFINGDFKWYIETQFQDYINNQQAINLPKLSGYGCFVVKSDDINDLVLIDSNQNIIDSYPYSDDDNYFERMICKINILKISKHYNDHGKANV